MNSRTLLLALLTLPIAAACSGTHGDSGFGDGSSSGGSSGGSGSGSGGTSSSSSGGTTSSDGGIIGSFGDGGSPPPPPMGCKYQDSTDHDGDGFSFMDGDCNDCDPNTNPGAFDVAKNMIDEDCDGTADNEPTGCDSMAVLDSTDPYNAALAMDVCRKTTETAMGKQRTWGVVAATFVAPDGSDSCTPYPAGGSPFSCAGNANFQLGHGNLTKLGVNNPRQGSHVFAISSGTARNPTDPGYQDVGIGFDKGFTVGNAAGFPAAAPACPGVMTGTPHDGIGLRLVIRVPTNAQSLSFQENFFSYEFPVYICSEFNDGFTIEMAPKPSGNVAFDQMGNPISVNNALLQVCDPQTAGMGVMKNFPCPQGSSLLSGTGFGTDTAGSNHAATGWLTTTVNVDSTLKGKDITLLFAIWDSGDGALDSTALIDNLTWSTMPGSMTPVTTPTPGPQ